MSKIPSFLVSFPRSGQHMTERILKEFHQKKIYHILIASFIIAVIKLLVN